MLVLVVEARADGETLPVAPISRVDPLMGVPRERHSEELAVAIVSERQWRSRRSPPTLTANPERARHTKADRRGLGAGRRTMSPASVAQRAALLGKTRSTLVCVGLSVSQKPTKTTLGLSQKGKTLGVPVGAQLGLALT